ncbi:hypothetical protein [Planktothrix paucivesiculata]|uniref:Uncharacterized protein n=1 Tax=Planktothrix paucivesiculata PCC 9631 TaxID=671071 RepID=A0A7Z9DUU9_9CYAN|nr:hypothetical protein [Planktothrix paucivesiculata]VXD11798.1 conserved hypothetical protein [Planktothrix paucivesiculata PCC 9631]
MDTLNKNNYKLLAKFSVSLTILGVIYLQFLAGNIRTCTYLDSDFFLLKLICPSIPDDPALYPFLDYPMYAGARYEGTNVNQYFLFGVLEDGTEVAITNEDLQTSRYKFLRNILPEIEKKNPEIIQSYVKIYEQKSQKNLVKLRLENHPLIITRKSINPGDKIVTVDLEL